MASLDGNARWTRKSRVQSVRWWKIGVALALSIVAAQVFAREKDTTQYGAGLVINIPFPENEVIQVVQDVAQNGIIRGTKEYTKDEYVTGANAVNTTRVFQEWTEGGKVFYKLRLNALDPQNFKDSNDMGTLAVRYIVQSQSEKNTILRIDAVFVEDFRHTSHASNGSVEGAEYKDIHDRLEAIESMKSETVEAEREKQEHNTRQQQTVPMEVVSSSVAPPIPAAKPTREEEAAGSTQTQTQTLEQRVQELRHQVERLVKAPGAPLKSAPFHTASTLQSLPSGTEVLIVISTPYWFGVETHAGQHGWMLRDELELLP